MANLFFNSAIDDFANAEIDWETDDNFYMMLLTGAGTPVAANVYVDNVLGESDVAEADATGYARVKLTTLSVSSSGGVSKFVADDIDFGEIGNGSNSTITGVLLYRGTADSADDDDTNKVIHYWELDTPYVTSGAAVTFKKNTSAGAYFGLTQATP